MSMKEPSNQAIFSESDYYARHTRLPGFSAGTQQKLRDARVLIVGVGGLGCPAATYLAGAGVGTITLCDSDIVSVSNLHRQMLFDIDSVGNRKTDVAVMKLRRLNPFIHIQKIDSAIDRDFLMRHVHNYDVVLDCTDNFTAKYAISDACDLAGIPSVFGAIFQYEGMISVFNATPDSKSPKFCYRDLYPAAPPEALTANCGEAGVIGVLPGIIGTLQAAEAIKLITGLGTPLAGVILIFDLLSGTSRSMRLSASGQKMYQIPPTDNCQQIVESINANDLRQRMLSANPPFLIDVREPHEHLEDSIGGINIPLVDLSTRFAELPIDRQIILYCKTGLRSARGVMFLASKLPPEQVLHLAGGIDGIGCGF
jgi:sulfur-carrier protein adenylyltransferase/sulfurtransferase